MAVISQMANAMLWKIRTNYEKDKLLETGLPNNPIDLFKLWLDAAIENKVKEPTAMVLSTVDSENRPHSRIVLLKDCTSEGFVFFTNYKTAKANQILVNQHVALTFFWPELERQVRVNGTIRKTSKSYSEQYFQERPFESRIAAWASPQSRIISSREELEQSFNNFSSKFQAGIPKPSNWGGYIIKPYRIEFWQGRPNRLHDRLEFKMYGNKNWNLCRLAP